MRNLNLGGLFVETDTPEFLAFLAFLVLAKGHVCKTEQTLLFSGSSMRYPRVRPIQRLEP
jgi:hypothetical protein